ncbi:hypothetical protein [Acidovorax sp. BL-A-41-H1]|uniref:hypothetical protein n=1 Tax=Acidovorax sp. BL-A-41-H1 TaxID=3421102 RepID=UPI003F7AD45D
MDGFERAERWQAAATAVGTLLAIVPAASVSGNIFVAILAALGAGSLAGGAVMLWWLRTPEGDACLRADARISGRSTKRRALWLGNLSPGMVLMLLSWALHMRVG